MSADVNFVLLDSRDTLGVADQIGQLDMILKMFCCYPSIALPSWGGSMHRVYLHVK